MAQGCRLAPCSKSAAIWATAAVALLHSGRQPVTLSALWALIALAPDVVLAHSSPAVAALQQETRTVPIVFVGVVDPVGAGFVNNLARPGGNTTGFSVLDYGMSTKWLQLLKEIVPGVTRVAVLRDSSAAGIGQLAAMQAVAPSLGMELTPIDMRDSG